MSMPLQRIDTSIGVPQVHELDAAAQSRWDAFVNACPEATFFHRAGWKQVLERAFGHRSFYLYAERDGGICGVLPLVQVRSLLFGNALVSTPFCVYGGTAAADEAACIALDQAAVELAQRLRVDYLELRNRRARHPDWPAKDLYATFRKPIDPDPERNLLAVPRKQRAMIRKGIDAGLQAQPEPDVERFYAAYSESMRNLGTPVFGLRYFRILHEVFADDCEVLTVNQGNRLVAGVLSFFFRDEVLPYYGGGTTQARALKGNDFMYWEVMRRACERGYRVFDYGRSKRGSGSYAFKKNWGFEPEPLHYECRLVRARTLPDLSPANPKYRLFIRRWSQLPLAVSRLAGPPIAKYLG